MSFDLSDEPIDLTPGCTDGWVWVHSDLQFTDPASTRQMLGQAVDDVAGLGLPLKAVWCLGDMLIGRDAARLEAVADVVVELLESLGLPICYVLGNHELDLCATGSAVFPLYHRATQRPLWHTLERVSDPWFARRCMGCTVVFFGDHADPAGGWWTMHHRPQPDGGRHPHGEETWARLRDALTDSPRPVITAGHYAFTGGQRPSAMMSRLLPLPEAVGFHLYGHAHIGDLVHCGDRPWQRDNPIEGQPQRQYNISALENVRTPGSHSALLRFRDGRARRLQIRCHLERRWVARFDLGCAAAMAS